MNTVETFEEVIEFIAAGTSPGGVIAFRPSEAARRRFADLLQRERTSGLLRMRNWNWTTICHWNT